MTLNTLPLVLFNDGQLPGQELGDNVLLKPTNFPAATRSASPCKSAGRLQSRVNNCPERGSCTYPPVPSAVVASAVSTSAPSTCSLPLQAERNLIPTFLQIDTISTSVPSTSGALSSGGVTTSFPASSNAASTSQSDCMKTESQLDCSHRLSPLGTDQYWSTADEMNRTNYTNEYSHPSLHTCVQVTDFNCYNSGYSPSITGRSAHATTSHLTTHLKDISTMSRHNNINRPGDNQIRVFNETSNGNCSNYDNSCKTQSSSTISILTTQTNCDSTSHSGVSPAQSGALPPVACLLSPKSSSFSDFLMSSEEDMVVDDHQLVMVQDDEGDDPASFTELMAIDLQNEKLPTFIDISFLGMEEFIKSEPGVPSFTDLSPVSLMGESLEPDSDGYASCVDYNSAYEQNVAFKDEYPTAFYQKQMLQNYNNETWRQQSSPLSDEGFVDEQTVPENLPNFEKIHNHSSEPAPSPEGSRSPCSSKCKDRKRKSESPDLIDKERRKPGRKPGQVSNVLHLWEFMRDLLHHPEHKEIIEWISRKDGVFRVVNSGEVARLWGEKKNNKKKMTYEKLSRSLRYSRLEGYFSDLPKDKNYPKKLCFKFGPKSRDWH